MTERHAVVETDVPGVTMPMIVEEEKKEKKKRKKGKNGRRKKEKELALATVVDRPGELARKAYDWVEKNEPRLARDARGEWLAKTLVDFMLDTIKES
jgi:protein involved in temperature-dependent protein secretion